MGDESKMLPRGREVDFLGEKVVVLPIPLRKWKELVVKVAEIVDLADIQALTGEGDFKTAFSRLQDAPEKIAELCALATPVEKDKVLDADFEQAFGLLIVAIEVNNVIKVLKDAIKKVKGPVEKVEAGEAQPTQ